MTAKPRLNVSFLSYSYPHRWFHPMSCTFSSLSYMHHIHRFLISPSVPASSGTCFSLSFSIQSWRNQPIFVHHSKLSPTVSHHPLCMWNYPLTTPPFPMYPNSIPTYPILHTFLWKPHQPVKRRGRRPWKTDNESEERIGYLIYSIQAELKKLGGILSPLTQLGSNCFHSPLRRRHCRDLILSFVLTCTY